MYDMAFLSGGPGAASRGPGLVASLPPSPVDAQPDQRQQGDGYQWPLVARDQGDDPRPEKHYQPGNHRKMQGTPDEGGEHEDDRIHLGSAGSDSGDLERDRGQRLDDN